MSKKLGLFEAFGIEIEYMVVDRDTLNISSVVDEVFKKATGEYASDFEDGIISWSNELVSHVIELKGTGPVETLTNLDNEFFRSLKKINAYLAQLNACLMPTAMHPWMNPQESKLWAHENNEVYDAYNRIFDCKGHGWSNLQSMHINLPFKDDHEFAQLHTAIRLLLPILPALSASSPVMDGELKTTHDNRLKVYQTNQKRVPSIAGQVIPEPVVSEAEYREVILGQIFQDIAPFDPEQILREEWLNSRGAIARFTRNAVEIRVLDCQECPKMDIAIASLITSCLRMMIECKMSQLDESLAITTEDLKMLFDQVVEQGEEAQINHLPFLKAVLNDSKPRMTKDIWKILFSDPNVQKYMSPEHQASIEFLLTNGSLAHRIQKRLRPVKEKLGHGPEFRQRLKECYAELCSCLAENRFFN